MSTTVLDQLREFEYPKINSGQASTIKDFFEVVIKPQFAKIDAIKRQHRELMDYVNSTPTTFFIRAHGSQKRENYGLLRRGFLSQYNNGVEYCFCDNTFALMFTSMKLAGVSMTKDELNAFFQKRNVKCGFAQTSPEKDLAIFTNEGVFHSNLNSNGWYLAHIYSVGVNYSLGKNDSDKDFSNQRDKYFPIGDRSEWSNETKIRRIDSIPSKEEMDLLKAHFVRFTHPLNNFLVPNRSSLKYNRGNLIGEEQELISYVSEYLKETFKEEYAEMSDMIYKLDMTGKDIVSIENIQWGLGVGKKNSKKKGVKKAATPKAVRVEEKIIPANAVDLNGTIIVKEEDEEIIVDKKVDTLSLLRRMGSEAFIYYYLPLKSDPDIEVKELASFAPKSTTWTEGSKRSRASVAKRIFKEEREEEVLKLILNQNVDANLKNMAKQYLEELQNEIPHEE